MKKIGLFALLTALTSLVAKADTIVTSKTYVDAKVQAQGSATGSILNSQSPDDKAPSSKAVYTALQAVSSATQNVKANWDETNSSSDAYILNKPTITNTASDITGAVATDTKELPTTYAVQQYVDSAVAGVASSHTYTGDETTVHLNTANNQFSAKTGAVSSNATTLTTGADVYNALNDTTNNHSNFQTYSSTENQISNGSGGWKALDTQITTSNGAPTTTAVKTYVDAKVSSAASISTSTTTAPNEKAVHDALDSLQSSVTALQSCTHTCTSSDPTNAPSACDLITINCVES